MFLVPDVLLSGFVNVSYIACVDVRYSHSSGDGEIYVIIAVLINGREFTLFSDTRDMCDAYLSTLSHTLHKNKLCIDTE